MKSEKYEAFNYEEHLVHHTVIPDYDKSLPTGIVIKCMQSVSR